MRVLVTGFAGYIGPVVVKRLRDAGHYVIGWDTGWFLPSYAEIPTWPNKVRFTDIRDAHVRPERVDAVVHLAGLSNDPMGELSPNLTVDINVDGTMGVLRVLPAARHVIVSSCSVYGGRGDIAKEADETDPLTTYAECKDAVDDFVHRVIQHTNAVSLRLGTVYGYSPGHRLDLVVNRMAWDAVNVGVVTATGNAARPLVNVEDVADAVLFMLDRPETGIYNVVGENVRMHALASSIGKYAAVPVRLLPPGADQRDYMASGDKLAALGFRPKRTVEGSLPVLFERTIRLPYSRDRYERLPALKRLMERNLDTNLRPKELIAA